MFVGEVVETGWLVFPSKHENLHSMHVVFLNSKFCSMLFPLIKGTTILAARIVIKERKESGPIRPCHLREAYRRLKLEGKVFKRSVPRLFR